MFGDDPDPTVTTVRVGSGTTFGCARGVDALCKEGVGGLARGKLITRLVTERSTKERGLMAQKKEKRDARQQFPETENVRRLDRLYCRYSLTVGLSNELRMR